MDAASVLNTLRQRHQNSTQASSRALLAVIDSIVELIKSESMALTLTAVFGASISPLEDPTTSASPEVRSNSRESCLPPIASVRIALLLSNLCAVLKQIAILPAASRTRVPQPLQGKSPSWP